METNKEESRQKILNTTRELLIGSGYDSFNIRSVASACNMSVGTLYHYFPGKDDLVRDAMLRDWKNEMSLLREQIEQKHSDIGKARLIYNSLIFYESRYMKVWCDYSRKHICNPFDNRMHLYVINDLRRVSGFDRFTLEILLCYAKVLDQSFDDIEAKLKILL